MRIANKVMREVYAVDRGSVEPKARSTGPFDALDLGVTMCAPWVRPRRTNHNMRRFKPIAIALVCALFLGACDTTVKTRTTTVSVGQQLIDLQNAYQNGSMTKDQYQKAKKQLIERVLD